MMGLTSHLSCLSEVFSSYRVYFSSMMSLTMMGLGPGHLVRVLLHFLWKFFWSCQWCRLWRFCSDWNQFSWWRCSVGCVRTNRSQVQSWLTHRNIFPLKILNFSHSFKIIFKIIVVFCLCFAHSICCSFFNRTTMLDPVGAICRPSDSGCGDADGTQFIRCVVFSEKTVSLPKFIWLRTYTSALLSVTTLPPIILLQPGVGSLCSSRNKLMEALSSSAFLASCGSMDRLGP